MNYKVCLHKISEELLPYVVYIKDVSNEEEAKLKAKEVIAEAGYWGTKDISIEEKIGSLVIKDITEQL